MEYTDSKTIFEKISASNNILLNCHKHPDADSVGSSLALYIALTKLDKKVTIICPDKLSDGLSFLPCFDNIETVDFSSFKYKNFDLFLVIDTSSWDRVAGGKDVALFDLNIVQIDHHKSNSLFGNINIVDGDKKSTAEIIYDLFIDWNIEINREIATCLLTGIIGDTGSFQFSVDPSTLETAAKLMRIGASKDEINFHLFRNMDFENMEVIGKLLLNMKKSEDEKFIYSAIPHKDLKHLKTEPNLDVIDLILQGIAGTEFGIRMIEKTLGVLNVSFRARRDFDTSKIALALGGGGHAVASGAEIKGMKFDDAVEKVLQTARKFVK